MALTVRIGKQYRNFTLDVEFSAGNGETLALLGASGSGKSTALQCVAGIRRPDWGRIELDGEVLFDSERHIDLPPRKRRVGYLFQQYALFPNMTVEQNIAASLGRLDRARRRARMEELVAMLRLEGTEKQLPRQLSGGQLQRTLLARAVISNPEVLVLDEPLSYVDKQFEHRIYSIMEDLARHTTVVLVSHEMSVISRIANRHLIVDHTLRACHAAHHYAAVCEDEEENEEERGAGARGCGCGCRHENSN